MPRQRALNTQGCQRGKCRAHGQEYPPNTTFSDDVLCAFEETEFLLRHLTTAHAPSGLGGLHDPDGVANKGSGRSYVVAG